MNLLQPILVQSHGLVRAAIDTCKIIKTKVADPADILLLDTSGSMSSSDYPPSRLTGAMQAINRFLLRQSKSSPNSVVGIVTFASRVAVVCPPVPLAQNFSQLQASLHCLRAGGQTNLGAGLRRSHRILNRINTPQQKRILILTDGYANEGASPGPIAEDIKQDGIEIEIIGIGGTPDEVNEATLRQMASVANGLHHYSFIGSVGELALHFEGLALPEAR